MPCKVETTKRPTKLLETDSETKGTNIIQKTKHACIVEAHESTKKRLESTLPKDHEDQSHGGERVPLIKSLSFGAQW